MDVSMDVSMDDQSLFPRNQHGVQFFVVNPGLVKTNSLQESGINPTRGMNVKDGVRGHLFCTCLRPVDPCTTAVDLLLQRLVAIHDHFVLVRIFLTVFFSA